MVGIRERLYRVGPLWLPAVLLLGSFLSGPLWAEKVKLDSGQWGHQAGEDCVSCHSKSSAGLASQWRESAHAAAGVNCMDCHQADRTDVDAIEHEGQIIATIVSPKDCGRCHEKELAEQQGSVHAEAFAIIEDRLPALADNVGGPAMRAASCDQCHGSRVKVKGDGSLDAATWPNSGIGRINPDGSKGSCSACHGRHRFSKAQAREPAACVRCHSGPDSPDKEIYEASKHGMIYAAEREDMSLESDEWVAGRHYTAAPTCVTCHMGGAGKLPPSHDVGMRNAWNLNAPISERQYLVVFEDGAKMELPESAAVPKRGSELIRADGSRGTVKVVATPKRRRQAMATVCFECHSKGFTQGFMEQFDGVVALFNSKFAIPARRIMEGLYREELLTPTPFDEPIEFTYWELWHDEGARARHGAAMMSPNHAWWEGMYLVGRNFYARFVPEARAIAQQRSADLVDAVLADGGAHAWLGDSEQSSAILGFEAGERP
ncbi:multiheme c-type cytochrome [Thiorhodococcus minor]|uniref:multiheme c-type cytochrome n=1 Tax=Thiorhodococcus minor TaxID=57489 RepID=UPI0031582DD3